MHVCVNLYASHDNKCPRMSEEDIRSPEIGVAGGWELSGEGAGI